MRKIEQRIIEALRDGTEFKAGNTQVLVQRQLDRCDLTGAARYESVVLLHGNVIAVFDRSAGQLEIQDGGWESVTTKSRLNAILSGFAPNYGVIQRDWRWYLIQTSGSMGCKEYEWESGAIFRAGKLVELV